MSGVNKNTCQHTRSIQRDRQQHQPSAPPALAIEQRLSQLISPACSDLSAAFHQLGMRERTLSLPVMASLMVSIVWRHLGSISDAVHALNEEGLLWAEKVSVSKQSVCERMRTLPAQLFEKLFERVVDVVHYRNEERRKRAPERMPLLLRWAHDTFSQVVIADASTLDSLVRKLALLRDRQSTPLGGKMVALLDAITRQPRKLWYEPSAEASEQGFWERILDQLTPDSLLLIDMGFTNYKRFEELTQRGIWFITRAKRDTAFELIEVLSERSGLRDMIVRLGRGKHQIDTPMRLVELDYNGSTYRYISNVVDNNRLPASKLAGLYRERWRIEDAFHTVKRLLGLAYFHSCSQNAIELQLWTTWLLYAALVDLRDELGDHIGRPSNELSLQKIYKALYFYTRAYDRGEADDPIEYLADNVKTLDLIKQKKKRRSSETTLRRRIIA